MRAKGGFSNVRQSVERQQREELEVLDRDDELEI